MDVQPKLDELTDLVESARAMPMSASCLVNRGEVLVLVDEIRDALPGELRQAQWVLHDREEVVEEGRREAERIVAAAHQERELLVSEQEVTREADREADRLVADARKEADDLRVEVEEYVDAKLAAFEAELRRILAAVERGRDKLTG